MSGLFDLNVRSFRILSNKIFFASLSELPAYLTPRAMLAPMTHRDGTANVCGSTSQMSMSMLVECCTDPSSLTAFLRNCEFALIHVDVAFTSFPHDERSKEHSQEYEVRAEQSKSKIGFWV